MFKDFNTFEQDFDSYFDMFAEMAASQTPTIQQNIPSNPSSGLLGDVLSSIESGGNYLAESPNSSAVGKYQFLWGTHGPDIMKLTGVKSKEEFLHNPAAQEAYYVHHSTKTLAPYAKKYLPSMQKVIPNITEEEVKGLVHFAGAGNMQKAIKSGNFSSPLDANGTSINSYLSNMRNANRKKKAFGDTAVGEDQSTFNKGVGKVVGSLAPAIGQLVSTWIGGGFDKQDPNAEPIVTRSMVASPYKFADGGVVGKPRQMVWAKDPNQPFDVSKLPKTKPGTQKSTNKEPLVSTLDVVGEVLDVPQNLLTHAVTGKYQQPGEALREKGYIESDYAEIATNMVLDPLAAISWLKVPKISKGVNDTRKVMEKAKNIKKLQRANNAASTFDATKEIADKFALGGVAGNQIEIEGGEATQTPNGQTTMFKGPSHAEGGIELDVPDGTKVYSDRVKVDNKTLAERKVLREKTLEKYNKKLMSNPTSRLLQNTVKRIEETNALEDMKDLQLQESIKKSMLAKTYSEAAPEENMGVEDMFPYGGIFNSGKDPGPNGLWDMINQVNMTKPVPTSNPYPGIEFEPTLGEFMGPNGTEYVPEKITTPKTDLVNPHTKPAVTNSYSPQSEVFKGLGGLTPGDIGGFASLAGGMLANNINSRQAENANTPNKNHFKGYGVAGLETNADAGKMLQSLASAAREDLAIQRNTSRARNRNSAVSSSTLRAMDTATDMGIGKGANLIQSILTQGLMQNSSQRSQLQNDRDMKVMTGEATADTNNRRDLAGIFSERSKRIANNTNIMQGAATMLNSKERQKTQLDLLSLMTENGIEFYKDANGKIAIKKINQ